MCSFWVTHRHTYKVEANVAPLPRRCIALHCKARVWSLNFRCPTCHAAECIVKYNFPVY
jgi:hypothetical protein